MDEIWLTNYNLAVNQQNT